jgi:hypothetical protein
LVGLLVIAGIGLLSGLYAGLIRLGVFSGTSTAISPMSHGPLMINGFLGTLIGLERAAALGKKWSFAAPVLMGLSTLSLIAGKPFVTKALVVPGSLGLVVIMGYLYYLQTTSYHLIMTLGAVSLLAGNVLYFAGFPVFELVGWWAGFPMLTIFGERLELNRIMHPPEKARQAFLALIILWLLSLVLSHFYRTSGWGMASVLLIIQSAWLIKYDVARKTIKSVEWTRYSAISLLTGYGWLIVSGVWGLVYGFHPAGMHYDALLHLIFVGFVFSMIFAHAAVIIPSLSGKMVPYHHCFYLPLILLHSFLAVRVIGDFLGYTAVRMIGSYGNVAAILLFLAGIVTQVIRQSMKDRKEAIQ